MGEMAQTTMREGKLPLITLDKTLYDMLSEDPDGVAVEALCNVKPNCERQYGMLPINKKYLITSSQAADVGDLAHMQLENVSYLLSFWAGPMEVSLVACEGWTEDDTLSAEAIHKNALTSFSVLAEHQRPKPRTYANVLDLVKRYDKSDTKIRWGFATDFAESIPSVIHAELHYKLNSKRWLAECSLRSANDHIIDPECSCSKHTTKRGQWFYGADCDECSSAVEKEIARVRDIVGSREPPYVLKLTQSLGSVGTSLVKTKEDREAVKEHITKIQMDSLPRLTEENVHIHPASLVISDFLPGATTATNFYIQRSGNPVFISACHQLSTRGQAGGRQQTALTWDVQRELENKYHDTLRDIGRVLHEEGYYGPAGADIMETPDRTQYVIDLNVRTTTSTILGLLKTHCEQRGFNAGMVFECLQLSVSREGLAKAFPKEFSEGRIILLGTTRLGKKDKWAYPIVLTGEDQDRLKTFSEEVLKYEAVGSEKDADAGGA